MSRPTERLEAELMALPPTDRARARRLIASLDDGVDDDPEVVAREAADRQGAVSSTGLPRRLAAAWRPQGRPRRAGSAPRIPAHQVRR
jgi:hypothetical protein